MDKEIFIDLLIGVRCDGDPANTGVNNGILQLFEIKLQKSLHWFV